MSSRTSDREDGAALPPGRGILGARPVSLASSVAGWVWFPFGVVLRFIVQSSKRIAVTIIGFVLLLAGIVMIVTPGPGILLIIAGLAVLATEYVWAERLLNLAKQKAARAKDTITRKNRSRPDENEAGSGG